MSAAPTLQHPGPRLSPRVQTMTTRSASVHATLPPGTRLIDALAEITERTGASCAQIEIGGGTLDRISYCVPAVCTDGSVAVAYSETREAHTPAQLVAGSATLGYRSGERFMHCHAAWLDAAGRMRAGHLWPETTIGHVPVYAVVHPLPGITMVSTQDPETCMPVFTPHPTPSGPGRNGPFAIDHAPGRRAAISRVLPGEDIGATIRRVCLEQGFRAAVVRAGLGSLVGACLRRGPEVVDVDGPATELATIAGRVHADAAGADTVLSAIVVDCHGDVHAGVLVPDRNPVAITFELLIIEDDEAA